MLKNNRNCFFEIGVRKILIAAKEAAEEIEGLKQLIFKIIFLKYIIFFFLTIILNVFFYSIFLKPIIIWIFGVGDGFWTSFGNIVLWTIQLTATAIISLISLRFTIELMYLWNRCLVRKIVNNFREIEEKKISLKVFWNEINFFLVESLKSCLLPILLLFVGLIPFLGLPIIFAIESHLLGKQCTSLYLETLNNTEEVITFKKKNRWLTLRLGWFPSLLTFVPLIGWLFLPITMTYQIIGFTYTLEKSKNF